MPGASRGQGRLAPLWATTRLPLRAFVVPLAQTALLESLPEVFADQRRIFAAYEALFLVFSVMFWWFLFSSGPADVLTTLQRMSTVSDIPYSVRLRLRGPSNRHGVH